MHEGKSWLKGKAGCDQVPESLSVRPRSREIFSLWCPRPPSPQAPVGLHLLETVPLFLAPGPEFPMPLLWGVVLGAPRGVQFHPLALSRLVPQSCLRTC